MKKRVITLTQKGIDYLKEDPMYKVMEIGYIAAEEEKGLPFVRIDLDDFEHPLLKKMNWNERIVYWIVFFRCGEGSHKTWSTNDRIAKDARMSPRTVKDIIPRLEKKKAISISKSPSGRRVLFCRIPLKIEGGRKSSMGGRKSSIDL